MDKTSRSGLPSFHLTMGVLNTLIAAVPLLQWATIITLFFVSGLLVLIPRRCPGSVTDHVHITGIAWCFNFWVIPIIKLNSSISAIAQFEETSRRGGIWLEPLNAGLAVSLAVTALILAQHPDPTEAATWKFYAAASVTIVQVAWWERVTIFPLDASVAAMKDDKANFKGPEHNWLEDRSRLHFCHEIDRWTRRHFVRATLPLLGALIAVAPKILHSLYQ